MHHWRKVPAVRICVNEPHLYVLYYRLYHRFPRSYRQRFQCPELDQQPVHYYARGIFACVVVIQE
jgi:hypothetical protein